MTAVRQATTAMDKIMYVLLVAALGTGMVDTMGNNLIAGRYDYPETVSPWVRSIFGPNPQPELMAGVPLSSRVHALVVVVLLALWPYTRLVHVFSAPLATCSGRTWCTGAATCTRTGAGTPGRGSRRRPRASAAER